MRRACLTWTLATAMVAVMAPAQAVAQINMHKKPMLASR